MLLGFLLTGLIITALCGIISIVLLCLNARQMRAELSRLHALISDDENLQEEKLSELKNETVSMVQSSVQSSVQALGTLLSDSQNRAYDMQDKRLADLAVRQSRDMETLSRAVSEQIARLEERQGIAQQATERRLEGIRETVEKKLGDIQTDNGKRLDEMRRTVDEKLQKTLDDKISQSFQVVSERLEQVYKGLGEMQNLAVGVGDLKKVLSNVKNRGIMGEIRLGTILEDILSPEQYEKNIVTKKGSGMPVEFAVKMPGTNGERVYLPIDAKFPYDAYTQLCDAYDSGDSMRVEAAVTNLVRTIKSFAKDISTKYIDPPATTEFGIMFLPFEGLYAEAVRHGLVEILQRDYKISLAGPTTMAALLNSLQMGFRTLAIQKRTGEVWNVLGAVKTEFDKFGTVLESTQKRLEQANSDLDKLVGVRTRQIKNKLRSVTELGDAESVALLDGAEEYVDLEENH